MKATERLLKAIKRPSVDVVIRECVYLSPANVF